MPENMKVDLLSFAAHITTQPIVDRIEWNPVSDFGYSDDGEPWEWTGYEAELRAGRFQILKWSVDAHEGYKVRLLKEDRVLDQEYGWLGEPLVVLRDAYNSARNVALKVNETLRSMMNELDQLDG